MKRSFIAVFLACFLYGILPAQTFEGVITIQSSSPEGLNATYYLKGTKIYVEHQVEEGMRTYLLDTRSQQKTLLILDQEEQLAVQMPDKKLLQAKSSELKQSTR